MQAIGSMGGPADVRKGSLSSSNIRRVLTFGYRNFFHSTAVGMSITLFISFAYFVSWQTLRAVTDGKIHVELERARLTRQLAKIRESEGKVAEAADLMSEVQVPFCFFFLCIGESRCLFDVFVCVNVRAYVCAYLCIIISLDT